MITKEDFLKKYNISDELFQCAEMSWEDLCEIYNDFQSKRDDTYEKILTDFLDTYLRDLNKIKIHSVRSRVKDAEHLIEKIIRKKQEKQSKYKNLDKSNYEKFITDIIGIRCLVLFKADWQIFHQYIVSQFENRMEYYVKDSIQDFDEDIDHFYIAEKPKVHIRNGDARAIYDEVLPPDSVIDGKIYRSVHYIIKYKGVYLEIQVRTLFEEGWGEIDHAVVYPYYQDDKILKEYTELLNRLSGLADEMSGFFYRLKELEIEALEQRNMNHNKNTKEDSETDVSKATIQTEEKPEDTTETISTPNNCMKSVLSE